MTALVATIAVVLYLLIPNFLFRGLFSCFIPVKQFERTTTQELSFAFLATLVPFLCGLCLICYLHPVPGTDYETIFSGLHSTEYYATNVSIFWPAAIKVIIQNGLLLSFFYLFVIIEAFVLGALAKSYARFKYSVDAAKSEMEEMRLEMGRADKNHEGMKAEDREVKMESAKKKYQSRNFWFQIYEKLVVMLVFPSISEFYLLFTTFLHPEKDVVAIDILTDEDHLYRGTVGNFFTDKDGRLTGIFLDNTERFDRADYLEDKKGKTLKPRNAYWKSVSGAKFYFPADKILNLNVAYLSKASLEKREETKIQKEKVKAGVLKEIGLNINVSVEPKPTAPPADKTDGSAK
jgi:hypothetical protein